MPQTILIAANDPNIIYLLQRYAEESGFQTVSVSQGKDVVALAQHAQPALIIMDTELSRAGSGQVLRHLRDDPATHHVPIVVYSCLDQDLREYEPESGEQVDGYLEESVLYDDFVAALNRAGVYS